MASMCSLATSTPTTAASFGRCSVGGGGRGRFGASNAEPSLRSSSASLQFPPRIGPLFWPWEKVKMGSFTVSPMGFGTWAWGNRLLWGYQEEMDSELQEIFNVAVRNGINLFDTADSYGTGRLNGQSERLLGRFIRDYPVRGVGVSNYGPNQLVKIHDYLKSRGVPLCSAQVQFSLLSIGKDQMELKALCDSLGICLISYSPLGLGMLSGKYTASNLPRGPRALLFRQILPGLYPLLRSLREIAKRRRKTISQVAINWCICKGTVPIPGVKTVWQAEENLGALGWRLSSDEILELESAAEDAPRKMVQNYFIFLPTTNAIISYTPCISCFSMHYEVGFLWVGSGSVILDLITVVGPFGWTPSFFALARGCLFTRWKITTIREICWASTLSDYQLFFVKVRYHDIDL
ncbi:hypothetical protein Taro_042633 [Colocasia esculenta]|uniref:NADP-dependent oxidoreductase domain-containing protein n=1 Tax=Colocasia esculenta TaxID=4460 RepID=A0A843WYZ1_COLES|nr:hypothetical protein [Colocasia esculenta]